MSNPELAILDRAVAILKAANTDAADRVYPFRKTHFRRGGLPAIGVFMLETDVEVRAQAPRAYKNSAVMVCELWVEGGLAIDTAYRPLMEFEHQVVQALGFDPDAFDDLDVTDFAHTGNSRNLMPSGERTTGEDLVSFLVIYETEAKTGATALPFLTANTTYDINGTTDPGNQPQDRVELEGATP